MNSGVKFHYPLAGVTGKATKQEDSDVQTVNLVGFSLHSMLDAVAHVKYRLDE